ncbi:MAG: hypothetical protein PVJ86_09835 [Phycisphaerales bacterium]|jgi:hypothetical protein
MVKVHLYGKLRRFSDNQEPARDSVTYIAVREGDTIRDIVRRIGIPFEELGDNIFLNGRYFDIERQVRDGDRLGLFPNNMAMIIV